MHLTAYLVTALLPIASAADVCFYVAPSQALPNPRAALPADTHATLTALGKDVRTAYLTTTNSFVFHNVTPGSYLVDFHSRSHGFSPLRLDLSVLDGGSGEEPLTKAWETFRGNDWDNKGEALQLTSRGFEARCLGHKNYFTERQKFSLLSILTNPMILLGLVSMVLFVGMPKLVENMDPEMKAEWDEYQKKGAMGAMAQGMQGNQQAPNPLGDFDLASYLSGSKKSEGGKKGKK